MLFPNTLDNKTNLSSTTIQEEIEALGQFHLVIIRYSSTISYPLLYHYLNKTNVVRRGSYNLQSTYEEKEFKRNSENLIIILTLVFTI